MCACITVDVEIDTREMAETSTDPNVPIYQNTNGVPLANGKNLHMEVG